MNLKSKKGFTLVELIIVIAILGIIALIAVPSLTGVQQRSQVNADLRTAEQIGKAVRIWLTDTGAGDAEARKTAIANWTALDSIGNNITEYITTDYVPKSYLTSGGEYFVKLTAGGTTGTDRRILVGIGHGSFTATSEQYKAGNAAGIAYIEGVSELSSATISAYVN